MLLWQGRRRRVATQERNNRKLLTKLNDDYIQSVQHSNVKRFDEILSDDFLCSNPDGTLIDRKAFLQQTPAGDDPQPQGARRQRRDRFRHHPRLPATPPLDGAGRP